MPLHFQGSNKATLGVEIELQIIDPVTMDLTPRAQDVLSLCEERGVNHVKAEVHQSMLEIDTQISVDVKECRKSLESTLIDLCSIMKDLGLLLSLSGTHPFQKWPERLIFPNDRFMMLHSKFRWLVKRMNVYGLHVHIGMPNGEKAIKLSRAMHRFLPYLLALSANSPFWQGEDTGMQACRPSIMESFPSGGLPPYLENWGEFEQYVDTMIRIGAMGSPKDLYWYIRPNIHYGTIEFRICDAMSSLPETMAVVAFIQCLVSLVDQEPEKWQWTQREHWIAPENHWIAARDGLKGEIETGKHKRIEDEIYSLVEEVIPIAKDLNCYEELLYIKTILREGNGSIRQRKIFGETGDLLSIVRMYTELFHKSISLPAYT